MLCSLSADTMSWGLDVSDRDAGTDSSGPSPDTINTFQDRGTYIWTGEISSTSSFLDVYMAYKGSVKRRLDLQALDDSRTVEF